MLYFLQGTSRQFRGANRVKFSEPQTGKFLPQLPQKRNKPAWASTAPSFVLSGKPPTDLLGRYVWLL